MSFTNEGNDDGPREDELDLGQEDEELPAHANGQSSDEDEGPALESHVPEAEEASVAYEDVAKNRDFQDDSVDEGSSQLPPHISERGDEASSSIPDDTPSLHGSLQSSPSSSALAFRTSTRSSPSPAHRPFDLRFESRLSSSSFSSPRPSSPFLLQSHSRNSSFASQPPRSGTPDFEPDAPQAPWEVVRWTKLRKIAGQSFSEIGRRNFGRPTCISVSTAIILGTSKGIVLVFDYQQNLKTIIGPGTKAVEAGAVTSLAISADHTTVAVGHARGEIFTWEITRAARPFLHIPPIQLAQHVQGRASDGHIVGVSVVHVGFLGNRRTALVSADDRGMAFSHLATRGMGAVARTVKTTRVLGRYPEPPSEEGKPRKPSSVLAFSPLPLGNVDRPTDGLGLVAILTPYLLVIVSTTPVAHTQFKAPRPKEVGSHSVMSAALAWFPAIKLKGKDEISQTKLVYCWSNVLTVLNVCDSGVDGEPPAKDRPPVLEFRPRSRWKANEAIVAVQWLSRSVLAVLTITQQLLILEDKTLRVTDSFDLLHKHIYHVDIFSSQLHTLVEQYDEANASMHGVVADAFYQSLKAYKGRLFLLGYNDLSVGSLSNWADRLLAYMETGDFVSAIRLATSYYQGDAEKLTVGLPEEDDLRHSVVEEKLLEMISASLKFAFGRNEDAGTERVQKSQLEALADASITACTCMEDFDYLWDEVYEWYEENESEDIFLDVLEPFIRDEKVRSMPPSALKALVNHYSSTYTSTRLEEVICLLDPTTMDIEQVTTLCKQHNLYDAFIYVWNRVVDDYVGPLEELLRFAARMIANNDDSDISPSDYENAMKIFPYLSFILTGRTYPTGEDMNEEQASKTKQTLYTYLFTGNNHQEPFNALRIILKFDSSSFMSMLNEAFEDSFLNDSTDLSDGDTEQPSNAPALTINRQYIVSILLDVMNHTEFGPAETIFLDIFIARNLPKYPQYILLSGSTLYQVLERLCRWPTQEIAEECELSVEYLLSTYHPPDLQSLIPLFKEAGYFRVLKSTYRAERQYHQLIITYLEDTSEREQVFSCIYECLRSGSGLNAKQQGDVLQAIKSRAGELARINVAKAAHTVQELVPSLHATFLESLDEDDYKQFHYLATLLEPQNVDTDVKIAPANLESSMVELYVQLLCRYNRSHVADYVDTLRVNELRLDEVLPAMEGSGVVDAAVVLLARQGQVRKAMDRLLAYLGTLESGLTGILTNAEETPDLAGTAEAVSDLLESVEKYSGVGIWLCQGQTKTAKTVRNGTMRGGTKRSSAIALQEPLTFEENLWLDLIDTVVKMARNISFLLQRTTLSADLKPLLLLSGGGGGSGGGQGIATRSDEGLELISSFRQLVQKVFTALLTSTTTGGPVPTTGVSFLRILRAFLARAATSSPSLSELRAVLASIFSAYTYEESLLSLANGMLDKDLFVHVNEVTKLRQHGWRPRGQACEICRRRIWGPGAGAPLWTAWERKQASDVQERSERQQFDSSNNALVKGKGRPSLQEDGDTHLTVASGVEAREEEEELAEGSANGRPVQSEEPGTEAVVVFACRHLYHRSCLVKEKAERSGKKPEAAHTESHPRSFRLDASKSLACTKCNST